LLCFKFATSDRSNLAYVFKLNQWMYLYISYFCICVVSFCISGVVNLFLLLLLMFKNNAYVLICLRCFRYIKLSYFC
jgi:hypothetical protein